MRQSILFGKTQKQAPRGEVSTNAQLLIRGGFIDKVAAGIYSYLPLGLRVLNNIQQIIREEMIAIGAQEVLLPALHPKEPWEATGRWSDPGSKVMYQFDGHGGPFGLGWTHEELITPLVQKYVRSYRDLPVALFQIQDKFRNESRAKSGLLRGREFSMKDLYSFHRNMEDLDAYYARAIAAYKNIFNRCGLDALVVEASGGAFSKYSHEFQVPTDSGEDIIFSCASCDMHQNKEVVADIACPSCGKPRKELKGIEVGNIFKLGTRFTQAVNFTYTNEQGEAQSVLMGCYGIGPSRVLGAVAEVQHTAKGLRWPDTLAPFAVHILGAGKDTKKIEMKMLELYALLTQAGVAVLMDDRPGLSYGEHMADADLIGLPHRIIVGEKHLHENKVEYTSLAEAKTTPMPFDDVVGMLRK